MHNRYPARLFFLPLFFLPVLIFAQQLAIPLPEHPRPDFERPNWENLNGVWQFEFDSLNRGITGGWGEGKSYFSQTITVPFPWGSPLSGVADRADIGWYRRQISVDELWDGKRVFLTIGASDWETTAWLDGQLLGTHRGGYTPFSFDLTPYIRPGRDQTLVIRADDTRRDFTLYGKQGYGNARGIWQTVYLEARGNDYLEALHFAPDIDAEKVNVTAWLPAPADRDLRLHLRIPHAGAQIAHSVMIPKGKHKISFEIAIPDPEWWSLDRPHLYEVEARLEDDFVKTYFGMRKISVVDLPGTDYRYIALNNEPIYLQLALDQSYHPEGFYTFPSDQFMREEIERSKAIGLNGIRTHVKIEIPRKLYWADKLGLLVMADLPNSWGEPDEAMQAEAEYGLRQMIRRDFNHPSIFSWIVFNETWGLHTKVEEAGKTQNRYLPHTQQWVAAMYYLTKSLDLTRLVEDNSICCGAGHTETDINSWHAYLPGWEWESHLQHISEQTYEGSSFDFEPGFAQGKQPNINSECGNVWGYEGSTGDVDWSWDYHRMMNAFRKYPKIAGWLYTEHHDVINEWNGYWRFDRTEKETGLGDLFPGMSLNDLHAPVYLSTGQDICRTVQGGAEAEVPLFLSLMTGADVSGKWTIRYELITTNYIGETEKNLDGSVEVGVKPWMQQSLDPIRLKIPDVVGTAILTLTVADAAGKVRHRNFMHFEILSETQLPGVKVASLPAKGFSRAEWSRKQWEVLDGKKVNGAGKGFFEFAIPAGTLDPKGIKEAHFLIELSAKQLFVKDQETFDGDQDYMKGSRVAPSSNPNAYPMSDETLFPSTITISIDGKKMLTTTLPDDPADHRGILSWHHQLQDKKLREAGSYGYLVKVPIPKKSLRIAIENGLLDIRIETEGEGGIAIYGKEFGRYAVDPSVVVKY